MSARAPSAHPMHPIPMVTDNETRLHGWRLITARVLVFGTTAFTALLCLLALPGLVPRLATPCADALNQCAIAPQQVAPLAALGITPYALALTISVFSYLTILIISTLAAVVLWHRSDDWMALLAALTLILMPMIFTPVLQGLTGVWRTPGHILASASFVMWCLLIGIFPSGRFVPRWLLLPVVVVMAAGAGPAHLLPDTVGLPLVLVAMLCLIAGQIYRYRSASTPAQRQQTKWVVSGLVLALIVNQAFWQPGAWLPAFRQPDSLYPLLAFPDSVLIVYILAVSFGVAILRHRLYDIDVIIRRTLIYGTLTAILAAVYFGSIVGSQALLPSFTHDSQLAIVASTLLIAALFQPLSHRIQGLIDHRFYRRKYNAARTLDAFATTLRQQVDLADLSDHLLAVVEETMQPAHATLWLSTMPRREGDDNAAMRQTNAPS